MLRRFTVLQQALFQCLTEYTQGCGSEPRVSDLRGKKKGLVLTNYNCVSVKHPHPSHGETREGKLSSPGLKP